MEADLGCYRCGQTPGIVVSLDLCKCLVCVCVCVCACVSAWAWGWAQHWQHWGEDAWQHRNTGFQRA